MSLWLALSVLPVTVRASREPITLVGARCTFRVGKDRPSTHRLKFLAAQGLIVRHHPKRKPTQLSCIQCQLKAAILAAEKGCSGLMRRLRLVGHPALRTALPVEMVRMLGDTNMQLLLPTTLFTPLMHYKLQVRKELTKKEISLHAEAIYWIMSYTKKPTYIYTLRIG